MGTDSGMMADPLLVDEDGDLNSDRMRELTSRMEASIRIAADPLLDYSESEGEDDDNEGEK